MNWKLMSTKCLQPQSNEIKCCNEFCQLKCNMLYQFALSCNVAETTVRGSQWNRGWMSLRRGRLCGGRISGYQWWEREKQRGWVVSSSSSSSSSLRRQLGLRHPTNDVHVHWWLEWSAAATYMHNAKKHMEVFHYRLRLSVPIERPDGGSAG